MLSFAVSQSRPRHLPAAKLAGRRRTTRRAATATRTLVLVTEDESAFFKIIWRHLDRHPVTRQRLDPVLFHFAGGVGDDLVSRIQLDAVAGIGEDFGHQSFKLDQLFFSHGYLQVDRRLAWPVGSGWVGYSDGFRGTKMRRPASLQ